MSIPIDPATLARLDQQHAAVTSKLNELVNHTIERLNTGDDVSLIAAELAGNAYQSNPQHVAALLVASVIQLAQNRRRTTTPTTRSEPHDGNPTGQHPRT